MYYIVAHTVATWHMPLVSWPVNQKWLKLCSGTCWLWHLTAQLTATWLVPAFTSCLLLSQHGGLISRWSLNADVFVQGWESVEVQCQWRWAKSRPCSNNRSRFSLLISIIHACLFWLRWTFELELLPMFELKIIWMFTARVVRMYIFFTLCVCMSVRVPKTDNFITTLHFAFTFGGGGLDTFRHVRLSVQAWVSVRAFCPFNGVHSTPSHFQTLPGHADQKSIPIPPPTHTPLPASSVAAVRSSLELILVEYWCDSVLPVLTVYDVSHLSRWAEYSQHSYYHSSRSHQVVVIPIFIPIYF